jgi:hypothetical protein
VARPKLADFAEVREIGLLYAAHVEPARLRGGAVLRALTGALEAARASA